MLAMPVAGTAEQVVDGRWMAFRPVGRNKRSLDADIFPQLASLFLEAAGYDQVPGLGRHLDKMKSDLIPVASDSVGSDYVGETTNLLAFLQGSNFK